MDKEVKMSNDYEYHILELNDDQIRIIRDVLEDAIYKQRKIQCGDTEVKDVLYLVEEAIKITEQYRAQEDPNYETLECQAIKELADYFKLPLSETLC